MSAIGSSLIPPLIHAILDRQRQLFTSSRGHWWAVLNLATAAVLFQDWRTHFLHAALFRSTPFWSLSSSLRTLIQSAEGLIILVLLANVLYYLWRLTFPWGRGEKNLVLSGKQMDLMHIGRDHHPGFQLSPQSSSGPRHPNPFKPLPGSFMSPLSAYGSPSSLTSQSPR